jgi:hypothetical protein
MSHSWQQHKVPLKFQVSDRTLFAIEFTLDVRQISLAEATAVPSDPQPPEVFPLPGSTGFLVRSQPVGGTLPVFKWFRGYLRYIPHRFKRYFIDLNQSFDEYVAKFSAKSRSTLHRKIRKFEQHSGGEIEWHRYADAREILGFHALARSLSEITYQERLLDAGLPNTDAFKREMIRRAEGQGVRGYLLLHESRPVAYLYCEVEDGVVIYRYLGYDRAYAKWSPGTVLHWLALEDLFGDQRLQLFDFTEGEGNQKKFFATGSIDCANVYFVCHGVGMLLLLLSHFALTRSVERIGDLLDQLGMKTRLKRIIRFGLKTRDLVRL